MLTTGTAGPHSLSCFLSCGEESYRVTRLSIRVKIRGPKVAARHRWYRWPVVFWESALMVGEICIILPMNKRRVFRSVFNRLRVCSKLLIYNHHYGKLFILYTYIV